MNKRFFIMGGGGWAECVCVCVVFLSNFGLTTTVGERSHSFASEAQQIKRSLLCCHFCLASSSLPEIIFPCKSRVSSSIVGYLNGIEEKMVKSIILMRHAEREDRAMEAEGKDWISTAPRPQDPFLSERGNLWSYAGFHYIF
jgi:hypothetical protein